MILSLFVAVHSTCGIISISTNIILIICMFRATPASFSSFGYLLKARAHAVADLYQAIGAAVTIPIGQAIVYIAYGPCYIAGPTVCYAFYMMQVGGANCTGYSTLASFLFRYLMLRNKTMTSQHAILLMIFVALPIPAIIMTVYSASLADESVSRSILYSIYPEYINEDLIVMGNENIRHFTMATTILLVACVPSFLYAIIIYTRQAKWKILTTIAQSSSDMSEKSKAMHLKFVHMLTLQTIIPSLHIFAIFTFFLGFFDVIHDPTVEKSTFLIRVEPNQREIIIAKSLGDIELKERLIIVFS